MSSDNKSNNSNNKQGLQIFLHPLVVINVSDHHTRQRFSSEGARPVYGCILGQQHGRKVEMFNSFEFIIDNETQINIEYLKTRQEQYNKTMEGCEILGWYSTGSEITKTHTMLHEQMEEISEAPLFLRLDPLISSSSTKLPISIYESTLTVVNGEPKITFRDVPFRIETTELERVGVDHIANVSIGGQSKLVSHLHSMHSSISMLNIRIGIIKGYLTAVVNGQLSPDYSVIRHISALTKQLPASESNQFKLDFLTEYNDTLLLTYLATITKASHAINQMMEKFNATYDRSFRQGRF